MWRKLESIKPGVVWNKLGGLLVDGSVTSYEPSSFDKRKNLGTMKFTKICSFAH